ncbi:hypothetical protein [Synechococcus sp. Cruz CV12-2-Slac-r]|uniref:hypothetical protein n=1 Tax=Synechococcus sp. Cruz CV12-2-Slac-r TaxID=2823748 RepID=UPI0020CFD04D|nr:hypothetical protein [Synechococcus sp. Cruz CV12-2-Slac-r]MCP9940022.1 hypothetical protein [Synechococcus sp. Cruz CV12-2-Slac-r]
MGFFDRFRRKPNETEPDKSFFLEPDSAGSLGDVNFMRRPYSIRRTFPGTAANPGLKERIEEVDSMASRLEKVSDGLPEAAVSEPSIYNNDLVPKPVKKTFAQQISQEELENRMRGSAVSGTNVPGSASKKPVELEKIAPPVARSAKPGSIDPFKNMLKDLG